MFMLLKTQIYQGDVEIQTIQGPKTAETIPLAVLYHPTF